MDGPLVSVIVPVYKVEAYLPQCVGSICGQTYANLQIILVDDGSPDESGRLCDAFAEKDSRIQVIHQPNSGVSAARNAALDAAGGTYVYFVDGDDWVSETMVEDTLPAMETGGYDLCAWGMRIVEEGKEDAYFGRWREETFSFSTEEEKRRFLCRWVLPCRVGWSVYCRAFRRSIIEKGGLRFDTECALFEDLDFFFRYTACCRNLYYLPKALYAYRQHGASAMHTNARQKQAAGILYLLRRQDRALSDQALFRSFYIYTGTALSVFLWNFTERGEPEQGLAQLAGSLKGSGDWEYLLDQARLAARDRAGIRRACGRRLGDQVNGLFRYLLSGDPSAYCRANRMQERFLALRNWKNRILHGVRGRE